MKQKGMEMAIQVFIILFVLLAVAVLVLQMLHDAFTDWDDPLGPEGKLEEWTNECKSLCSTTRQQGTEHAKINFCSKKLAGSVTETGVVGSYDNKLLLGIGICDDAVYCPTIYNECEVGGSKLTMENCVIIMCNYWENQLDKEFANEQLTTFITPGKCYENLDESERRSHWYTLLFDKEGTGTEAVCP